jgi:serine/threonine-protein kinase
VTPPPISNPSTSQSFGAIARSPAKQDKGYAWNYVTRQEAEARALSECEKFGASDCQVMIWAANACLSISEGSNGSAGTAWSVDKTAAENKAKEVCQDFEGVNCTITRTICLPVNE